MQNKQMAHIGLLYELGQSYYHLLRIHKAKYAALGKSSKLSIAELTGVTSDAIMLGAGATKTKDSSAIALVRKNSTNEISFG